MLLTLCESDVKGVVQLTINGLGAPTLFQDSSSHMKNLPIECSSKVFPSVTSEIFKQAE